MISMTHSLFNAGLARLPRAEIYISAFAVAKSILFIFQSPVIMIRQTVTSLVNDSQSYYRVRKFVFYLSFIVLGLYVLFVFTELSAWVLKNIMGLNGDILKAAVVMLKVFTIFLMSISLR
jgi:cobalamin synthase